MRRMLKYMPLSVVLAVLPVMSVAQTPRDTMRVDKSLCDSPARFISGRISGVQVGEFNGDVTSGANVLVRGVNSVRTAGQPLWIVDGMPLGNFQASHATVENQLSFLNAYDVESIEVIKDLSAAAIYGSMGANGVIIVNTTRRGRADGLKIEWNSSLGAALPYGEPSDAYRTGLSQNHSVGLTSTKGNSMLRVSVGYIGKDGAARRNSGNSGNFSVMYETMVNPVLWFGTNTMLSIGLAASPDMFRQYGDPSLMMAARFPENKALGTVSGFLADFDNDARIYRVVNSSSLTVNFLKELNFKADFGMDYHNLTRWIWFGPQTPSGAALNGKADIDGYSQMRFFITPSLNWKRHFEEHAVELSAGAKIIYDDNKSNLMEGSDFFSHELRAKGLNIHSSKTTLDYSTYGYLSYSAFLKGAYRFRELAGVDFSVMPQWTPRYGGAVPVLYYGAEAFVNVYKGIRLAGGYGTAGAEIPFPYGAFGNFLPSYDLIDPSVSFYYEGLMRTGSKEWHAGTEIELWNGKFNSSLKYFRRHTDDAFNTYCFGQKGENYLWEWSGRTDVSDRTTSFTSYGVEVDIDTVPVKTEDWQWSLGTSFTWYDNVVTAVSGADLAMRDLGGGMTVSANVTGRPIGSFVGYEVLAGGSIVDRTSDGRISKTDMTILGSPTPKLYGAVRTSLMFKDFHLDAVLDWQTGGHIADLNAQLGAVPDADGLMSSYVKKSDMFRMNSLCASYDFNFPRARFLKSLTASLSAYNLFAVSAYDGWNPLADCYAAYGVHGVDYASFKLQRTLVAGVKLVF